jgi:hypothetical protein
MNIECCSNQLGNTGVIKCDKPFGTIYTALLVNLIANDGTRNKLTVPQNGQITEASITALINQTDKSKRLYPLPEAHNPESDRPEPITEEDTLGNVEIVRDAARTESMQFWKVSTAYLAQLKKFEGKKNVGIYLVSKNGSVEGIADGSDLYPIPLQALYFNYMRNNGSELEKVMMSYQYKMNVSDGDLAFIGSELFESDMTSIEGLINGFADIVITPSLVTAKVFVSPANIGTKVGVPGLLVGDFSFANVTQSNTFTLGTLTETSCGVYEITITGNAPIVGDDITPTITKSGFDFESVNDQEIEVVSGS